jgi:hypothetical protein
VFRILCSLAGAGLALASASPAQAQYSAVASAIGNTIGQMAANERERACLLGRRASSEDETAQARGGAEASMRDYLAAAGAAERADVSRAFSSRANRRTLIMHGAPANVAAVSDPLARSAAQGAAVVAPTSFSRASDGRSAAGIWAVRASASPDAAPIGQYVAEFRHERLGWRLTRLEIVDGAKEQPAIAPYCHRPGDVEAYVRLEAEREARRAERRAAREAQRQAGGR